MPQLDYITFFSQIFWLIIFFSLFYVVTFKSVVPFVANSLKVRAKKKAAFMKSNKGLYNESEATSVSYNSSFVSTSSESKKFVLKITQEVDLWESKAVFGLASSSSSNSLYIKNMQQLLLSQKGVSNFILFGC